MKKNFLNGRKIKMDGETIYEINLKNSPFGVALAEIRNSKEHFHKNTKEWYYVIAGEGKLFLNEKQLPIRENDFVFIPPKSKHFVTKRGRKNLRVLAITIPSWDKKDHYLV